MTSRLCEGLTHAQLPQAPDSMPSRLRDGLAHAQLPQVPDTMPSHLCDRLSFTCKLKQALSTLSCSLPDEGAETRASVLWVSAGSFIPTVTWCCCLCGLVKEDTSTLSGVVCVLPHTSGPVFAEVAHELCDWSHLHHVMQSRSLDNTFVIHGPGSWMFKLKVPSWMGSCERKEAEERGGRKKGEEELGRVREEWG